MVWLRRIVVYGAAVLAIEAVGSVIGYATSQAIEGWYDTLRKPPLNPPDAAFAIVWPILYAMIAVAGVMVWRTGDPRRRTAMIAYAAQLLVNFAWTGLFFTARMPGAALAWIVLLLVLIGMTVRLFRPISRVAATLLLPYAAWVGFAAYLNAGIWWLNG